MTKTCINFSVQWRFQGSEVQGMCTYVRVRMCYIHTGQTKSCKHYPRQTSVVTYTHTFVEQFVKHLHSHKCTRDIFNIYPSYLMTFMRREMYEANYWEIAVQLIS